MMEENNVTSFRNIVIFVIDILSAKESFPTIALCLGRNCFYRNTGHGQTEADEHRAPLCVRSTKSFAIASIALFLIVIINLEVASALLIANLRFSNFQQLLSIGKISIQSRKCFPGIGFINRNRTCSFSCHSLPICVCNRYSQSMLAKFLRHITDLALFFIRRINNLAIYRDGILNLFRIFAARNLNLI